MCWPNPTQFVFHDVASILKSKSRKPFTVDFNSAVVSCGEIISEEFLLFGSQEIVFLNTTEISGAVKGWSFWKIIGSLLFLESFGF